MRFFEAVGLPAVFGLTAALAACGRPVDGPTRALAQPAAQTPSTNGARNEAPEAPEFPAGAEWLNTNRPLTMKELRGKIVLLDFWTSGCINCMHIIPDLKRLEKKYRDELAVVGVHSAKFLSEREVDNIREAILRYELEHPVVNDKDFLIWNTYGVSAWPTLVLIAPDGKVVGARSGEGVYEPFDRAIGMLVKEFDARGQINRQPLRIALEKDRKPKSVLSYPGKIAADARGRRLFFTDSNHNRVIIASLNGAIQEVIGEGAIGLKDGDFQTAQFFHPQGLCYDATRNALYVADTENHAIRKIDLKARRVTTLAGTGQQAGYPPQGGVGRSVALNSPWDVLLHGSTLYIAMAGSHQLWTLDLKTLRAEPYAGTAGENIVDGPLAQALLAQPSGLTTDGKALYFADSEASAVRRAGLAGKDGVKTIIGEGLFEFGDVDGPYPKARLQHPLGVAYHNGYVYVADTYNHKIKRVHLKTRRLETFIGTGRRGMADGPAKKATLNEPGGLVFVGETIYIADTNNHLIRAYDPAARAVRTLRLTGIEKLAKRTMPAFTGKEQRFEAQEVSPEARTLEIVIELPKGTKFNKAAPFRARAKSDRPEAVAVGAFQATQPAAKLSIPIVPKSGEATLSVDLTIHYCDAGNEGLCYFKETRLIVPVRVAPGGASSASVTYAL